MENTVSNNVDSINTDRINNTIESLCADYERQGNRLEKGQLDRFVLKKRLNPYEILYVIKELARRGIITEQETEVKEVELSTLKKIEIPEFIQGLFDGKRLTDKQERDLSRSVQLGLLAEAEIAKGNMDSDLVKIVEDGISAKKRFITGNLRLVLWVANSYKKRTIFEISDLVQEGIFGLSRAIELYNPDLGFKFSTYATWWIKQSIHRGLDNHEGIIRVPVHRLEQIRKYKKALRELTFSLGREPNNTQLAGHLEWSLEKAAYIGRLSLMKVVSADLPVSDDGETSILDLIPSSMSGPDECFEHIEQARIIKELLETLNSRQQIILRRRFGLDTGREETLQEIGDDLGVTRERIRQLEAKALSRLYRRAKARGLREYIR
jgi:RNA polymerase primary sigma factor